MGSSLTLAAASSMASGRPSKRLVRVATASAFPSVSMKSGLTARARSTNKSTASNPCKEAAVGRPLATGSPNGGIANSCSPAIRRERGEVTMISRIRCRRQQLAQERGGLQHLLEVVEDHQNSAPADQIQAVRRGSAACTDRKRPSSRGSPVGPPPIPSWFSRENEVDAPRVVVSQLPGQLHREAGLAGSSGPGQSQDPGCAQELDRGGQLMMATDELREDERDREGKGVESLERGEFESRPSITAW